MQDYKPVVEKFINEHKHVVMATVSSEGQPMAHTVGYASDGAVLYFSTAKITRKAQNILANPRVGYTIDMDEDADFTTLQGLQMLGKATVIEDHTEAQKAGELLQKKFPEIPEMPPEMEMVIVKVEPVQGGFFDNAVEFGFSAELKY